MKKIAARDGAYDKRYVYRMTSRLVIHPVTPTRKNARYDQKWRLVQTERTVTEPSLHREGIPLGLVERAS